jgi:23S rRNA pseudouridine1911/1915/1917 synthase
MSRTHEASIQQITASSEDTGKRLDQFLVSQIPDVSRVRVQQLIEEKKVLVDGKPAKASLKLRGTEQIDVSGEVQLPPLRAIAEEIPLDIVYEDDDLIVINKPAGMMVHAGAGATEDARNRGTLVNALLHRFQSLSEVGGDLRPGIVHRLDRQTSGLMVVAKNDVTHRKLATAFSSRRVHKTYLALVQGRMKEPKGTVSAPISRDRVRRTRMTTKLSGGREAISHYRVREQFETAYGKFSLVEVKIETGRTHQIRVHLSSLGHPVVGDTLYGAAGELKPSPVRNRPSQTFPTLSLPRNFLHAAEIEFAHPKTGKQLAFSRPIPPELTDFLDLLKHPTVP